MTWARAWSGINVAGIAVVVAFLVLWQLLVASGILAFDFIASPVETAQAVVDLTRTGRVFPPILHTLATASLAVGLALVIGVVLGTLLGRVTWVREYSSATIDIARSIPVVALMPVALLVWGAGWQSEVIVATYGAVWFVVVNTAVAVTAANPRLFEVARVLQLSRGSTVRKIVLPSALPGVLVGARLGATTALVIAIVAEMIINPAGMGWAIVSSQQALNPAQMWAWVVLSAAIGFAFNWVLVVVSRLLLPGDRQLAKRGRS